MSTSMRLVVLNLALLLASAVTASCAEGDREPVSMLPLATTSATAEVVAVSPGTFDCNRTPQGAGHYGNDAVETALWSDGTVVFEPGGPGRYSPGGPLAIKWPWWRGTPGAALSIEGRRLDADAPALEAVVTDGYPGEFQPTSLIFSTPGCWEVTASTVDGTLTFVTLVVVLNEPRPRSGPPVEATAAPFECQPTIPNGSRAPGQREVPTHHGNGRLWVALPRDGIPSLGPGGYGGLHADGSVEAKFPIFRADADAEISVEGRRLDAPAPPLDAKIFDGYAGTTFQASNLLFPSVGCWEVTVRTAEDSLTIVMLLEAP